MGTTLGIAHNVFDKVKVEKDRKERLKDFDDWQKEKAKKVKALKELQDNLRRLKESREEDKIVTECSINSATSVGEGEDIEDQIDIKTGARRKTSRPYNRSSIKLSHHKDSISSTSSLIDEAPKRRGTLSTEIQNSRRTSGVEGQNSKQNVTTDPQSNYRSKKVKSNNWLLLRENVQTAKNFKPSISKNAESKLSSSSSQRNSEVMDRSFTSKDGGEHNPTTSKKIPSQERKSTGCGVKGCAIL